MNDESLNLGFNDLVSNSSVSNRNARNRRFVAIAHNRHGRIVRGPAPVSRDLAGNRDRFPNPNRVLNGGRGFARGDVRPIVGFTILCFKCGGGVLRRSLGRRTFLVARLVVARRRRRRLALQSSTGCIFARCRSRGVIRSAIDYGLSASAFCLSVDRNVVIDCSPPQCRSGRNDLLRGLCTCRRLLLRGNRTCCFLGFNSLRLLVRSGIGKRNRRRA